MPKPTQALFIAAPASGQGKTTITAGLAYYYRQQGKRVRVFKTGPDFIDPMLHQLASGHPVYQLDLWMGGEAHCRQLLADAAQNADIHRHLTAQKPLLAECGGLLVLLDSLTDKLGATEPMWGLVQGDAVMQQGLAALGMQSMTFPEGTLHGHTFHDSKLSTHLTPIAQGINPHGKGVNESAYRIHRLTASYVHSYFPSNPTAVAGLFSMAPTIGLLDSKKDIKI